MTKNQENLLKYLLKQTEPVTSQIISNKLNISIRTVKSYIKDINSLDSQIIISSKVGYTIVKDKAIDLLNRSKLNIPQNYDERAYYIIKQLLVGKDTSLDAYELCEKLCISYSTLKLDVSKMNSSFEKFEIKFVWKNDALQVIGKEKNKRKLVSHVLYEEANNSSIDLSLLESCFDSNVVKKISDIIVTVFRQYNYYINDFSFMNLVIHFTILINRIRSGNSIDDSSTIIIKDKTELELIEFLTSQIEDCFNIIVNNSEKSEIYMLFKTNINPPTSNSMDDIRYLVSDDLLNITHNIIRKINNEYMLDLMFESFIIPFSLHLKNLMVRVSTNHLIVNPMVDTIKESCPSIYDIAIFISIELRDLLKVNLTDDEIAFIALHVGSEIERQKIASDKIQCVLLCPDYRGISNELLNKLLYEFGNEINIFTTVSYQYQLQHLKFDLLISTLPVEAKDNYKIIVIPPFIPNLNKVNFYEVIERIKKAKQIEFLKKNFSYYFEEKLFFTNPSFSSKEEIIEILSSKMLDLQYVNEDFMNNALEREKACSTLFGNIAIPHSMYMNAIKTNVAVIISKEGINWGNGVANIILLVAINKFDKNNFRILYETLIMLFSRQDLINLIKNCDSFESFRKIMLNC